MVHVLLGMNIWMIDKFANHQICTCCYAGFLSIPIFATAQQVWKRASWFPIGKLSACMENRIYSLQDGFSKMVSEPLWSVQ